MHSGRLRWFGHAQTGAVNKLSHRTSMAKYQQQFETSPSITALVSRPYVCKILQSQLAGIVQ